MKKQESPGFSRGEQVKVMSDSTQRLVAAVDKQVEQTAEMQQTINDLRAKVQEYAATVEADD